VQQSSGFISPLHCRVIIFLALSALFNSSVTRSSFWSRYDVDRRALIFIYLGFGG